jgi:hypothetical protein
MKELLPEDQRITRLSDEIISAKPLIDACRYLQRKLQLVKCGIEDLTPTDKFFIQVMATSMHYYPCGGTATTLPDDIVAFIDEIKKATIKAY